MSRWTLGRAVATALLSAVACGNPSQGLDRPSVHAASGDDCDEAVPAAPLDYGVCVLGVALRRAASKAKVNVVLGSDEAARGIAVEDRSEAYAIVTRAGGTVVVGRDSVGAMYGALDVAERLDEQGAAALPVASAITAAPVMAIRAANLFLVLPEPGETSWWFRQRSFWTEYLDMMARARLNMLDLHGMYDPGNTLFPNALLYFATSKTFADVGIAAREREANLAMLNEVIAMATARGIKVGLMSYQADLSLHGDGVVSPSVATVDSKVYTREAVASLAGGAPALSGIGFRVGESGRDPSWYADTYVAALEGAHALAYTRTWRTTKNDLLALVTATGPDTIVEAKYNGEHIGPPYVMSGGGMQRWNSYSFEDFLEPPAPYRLVLQLRAGGTHRIFRFASYARMRRAVLALQVSPRVAGFSFEAAHAYLPQRDFYHANPSDSLSPWTFRRDELSYLLVGRLGYDPNTPESVFRGMLARRVGTDTLWPAVQAASDITPWIQAAHTCGPDQRDYAPELDLAGPVGFWATPLSSLTNAYGCEHQAFDEFAIALPYEAAEAVLNGTAMSRLSPRDVALTVLADAKEARSATSASVDETNVEARDVVRECVALADLGEWFGHKLLGATALAVYQESGADPWLQAARGHTAEADAAYTALAIDTSYITPFVERMRMSKQGLSPFHWREQLPHVAEDMPSIDLIEAVESSPAHRPYIPRRLPDPMTWLATPRPPGPGLTALVVTPADPLAPSWVVEVTLATPVPEGSSVKVLHRPFTSTGADWSGIAAVGSGAVWQATVPGTGVGGMFAAEVVEGGDQGWRYPDVTRETPYVALPP